MTNDPLTWSLGLVAAYLAVRWQSAAQENKTLRDKLNKKKEDLYIEIIKLYMEAVNGEVEQEEMIDKMRKINEKLTLTASNNVMLVYGDMMQTFMNIKTGAELEGIRLFGELILAMRKDLGHKDWLNSLYWFDPMRTFIKDIGKNLPERFRGCRKRYNKTLNTVNEELPKEKSKYEK